MACTLVIFALVISGVWNNGLISTPLVISAFATVFGSWAAPMVTFLSVSFGLGVLVAYAFLGNTTWKELFGKKHLYLFTILFSLIAFIGTLVKVNIVWDAIDLIVALLIVINLSGILWMLPELREYYKEDIKLLKK
jgi:AGCS family alanine or glycine:cation symporter